MLQHTVESFFAMHKITSVKNVKVAVIRLLSLLLCSKVGFVPFKNIFDILMSTITVAENLRPYNLDGAILVATSQVCIKYLY